MLVVMTGCDSTPGFSQEIAEVISAADAALDYAGCYPLDTDGYLVEDDDYKSWFHFIGANCVKEQPVSPSVMLEILPGRDCPLEPG